MIPCMILVGHHLNSVLKEVFFLVGCLRRVRVETNVYWAWVLYLAHLIQMKILWGHYYRPIIPYPKLWSHDFRKVILCITLHLQWRLGLHPLISYIHMSVAKPMIVTQWGKVSFLYTYEKIFTHCFQSFLHFWIVDKIVWPELAPSYRLRELA